MRTWKHKVVAAQSWAPWYPEVQWQQNGHCSIPWAVRHHWSLFRIMEYLPWITQLGLQWVSSALGPQLNRCRTEETYVGLRSQGGSWWYGISVPPSQANLPPYSSPVLPPHHPKEASPLSISVTYLWLICNVFFWYRGPVQGLLQQMCFMAYLQHP